jgi:leucyl aminopeptidase (aminopeptidase T)
MVDLPDKGFPDNPEWADRRRIALEWFHELKKHAKDLPFRKMNFCLYNNVGSNNGDLPDTMLVTEDPGPDNPLLGTTGKRTENILEASSVVVSMTQFSATAPLKVLARKHLFRGATMPGFTRAMIPALGLDYEEVHRRVHLLKERMDRSTEIHIAWDVRGKTYEAGFDTRFREGHASGGLMRERGIVANLPSGEAYIVPYEGERQDEPSMSYGTLPVQFEDEVVVHTIEANRVSGVDPGGRHAAEQERRLREEPAYGNIAEIGIGVLGEWGVQATGSTLVDEKLGLHVAFGRSDHFGGATGPSSFRNSRNVIHIDWVYVPSVQPLVHVKEVVFQYGDEGRETVMQDGKITA